jgi:hypothetical protein
MRRKGPFSVVQDLGVSGVCNKHREHFVDKLLNSREAIATVVLGGSFRKSRLGRHGMHSAYRLSVLLSCRWRAAELHIMITQGHYRNAAAFTTI